MSEGEEQHYATKRDIAELRKRISELEDALEEATSGATGGTAGQTGGYGDSRDSAVVEHLEPGQTVGIGQLKQLYRTHTDIRSDRTLKNRVKSLTKSPLFDHRNRGAWVYTGGGGDE